MSSGFLISLKFSTIGQFLYMLCDAFSQRRGAGVFVAGVRVGRGWVCVGGASACSLTETASERTIYLMPTAGISELVKKLNGCAQN